MCAYKVRAHLLLWAEVLPIGLLFVFSLLFPVDAAASCPVPGGPSIALGFHSRYEASGGEVLHLGVDLAANESCTVSAPCSGTISFVGAVPASEQQEGPTMLAVSLLRSDGYTVTLMPFKSVDVKEGQVVSDGAKLGLLAAAGDRSVSSSHLHIGLKQGERYFDPTVLFGFSDSTSVTQEESSQLFLPDVAIEQPNLSETELTTAQEVPSVGVNQTESVDITDVANTSEEAVVSEETITNPASVSITSAGATLPNSVINRGSDKNEVWAAIQRFVMCNLENIRSLFAEDVCAGTAAKIIVAAALAVLLLGVCMLAVRKLRVHASRLRRPKRSLASVNGTSYAGRGDKATDGFAISAGQ